MPRSALVPALLIAATSAQAWDTNTHKVIGVIASRHLTPETRAYCDAILATNPVGYQDFLNAAPLPDYLKHGAPKNKPPLKRSRKFDGWHYIDYPVRKDQTSTTPYDASIEGNGDNALYGLAASVRNVRSGLPSTHGLYLSMILHVVGDLHQPLHCAERDGDKGGNDFRLKGSPNNLHAFWDDVLTKQYRLTGRRKASDARIGEVATDLERRYPLAALANEVAVYDPVRWAAESYGLAVGAAYDGVLPGSRPSEAYKARSQVVADRRVALAGYRLAEFLNRLASGRVKA